MANTLISYDSALSVVTKGMQSVLNQSSSRLLSTVQAMFNSSELYLTTRITKSSCVWRGVKGLSAFAERKVINTASVRCKGDEVLERSIKVE